MIAGMQQGGLLHRDLTIVTTRGLHARASARVVQTAERFDAEITVSMVGTCVGGTSILGVLLRAAGPGSVIQVAAVGREADAALEAIAALIADYFGEGC
jgi:phosphocarrier protein